MLTNSTAFEGLQHPYKKNIIKIGGTSVLGPDHLPEIKRVFEKAKTTTESAPASQ